MSERKVRLTECPRDAMQGIKDWIPTDKKIKYINSLLEVGFDVIDFGSFVSPKAIPQMRDTAEVLAGLNLGNSQSELLAIVANLRGAQDACSFPEIDYLGYPFSISEEFQMRNTNTSIDGSLSRVEDIVNISLKHKKEVVIYISMAFGNPYGEHWHPDIAIKWSEKLNQELGIKHIALSDTIGVSNKENIDFLFTEVLKEIKDVNFGAHLHTTPDTWHEKIESAFLAGCNRFDGALKGYGGCPMAKDELTGNMPTENIIGFLNEESQNLRINELELNQSLALASEIFNQYH